MRAAAVTLAAIACAGEVLAQDGATLRDIFRGARPSYGEARVQPPPVARYVAGDDREFVLDRSGQTPLLKFEGSTEVWALRATPGPGGDVIYKDDTGRPIARASRLGGLTVFTADRPGGMAAALAGSGSPLRPAALSPQALFRHLAQASFRVKQMIGHLIVFDAQEVTPQTSALYADAATLTAEAFARLARRRDGRARAARLREVQFQSGSQAGVAVNGSQLQVTLSPRHGLAGRPSSQRIMNAVLTARN